MVWRGGVARWSGGFVVRCLGDWVVGCLAGWTVGWLGVGVAGQGCFVWGVRGKEHCKTTGRKHSWCRHIIRSFIIEASTVAAPTEHRKYADKTKKSEEEAAAK